MATAMEIDSDEDDDLTDLRAITQFDSADVVSNLVSNVVDSMGLDLSRIIHDIKRTVHLHVTTQMTALSQEISGLSYWQQLCIMVRLKMKFTRDRYQSLCEILHVLEVNEETDEVRQFKMLRSQYQKEFYDLVSAAGGQDLMPMLQGYQSLQQPLGLEWSRYHREFEEVSFLAGGGFGKVFRARNKLDGIVYAVKKIAIRSTTIKNVLVHLAEVKTLAKLNHINIVPYKAAWLEPLLSPGKSSNSTNGSSTMYDGEEEEEEEEDDDDDEQETLADMCGRMKHKIIRAIRRSEKCVHFEGDPAVSAGDENRNQVVELEDPPSGAHERTKGAQAHLKPTTLYIQMTLCDLTLREWLDERNASKDFDQFYVKFQLQNHLDVVLFVFQQLLNGLNYIHSRGIVHHDIKPSNIFVSRSDHDSAITIQLGDFGLSCSRQSSHPGVGFGTPLYAAPEQLKGTGKSDPKSDLYSLGIVLVELLVRLANEKECGIMIEQVRRGQYPPGLHRYYTELLKNLLQNQPSCRPGMRVLLKAVNHIRINRDKVIAELRQSFSLRNDEIVNLRTQMDEQQRVQLESDEERLRRTSRTVVVKEQELINMSLKIKDKDEEICKLKEMLRTYQEKEEGNGQSGDAKGQETNGAAR